MNVMEDVIQNLEAANETFSGSLTSGEIEILNTVKSLYANRIRVNCTTCGYCMPCPSGVNIPGNFGYYNDFYLFETPAARETTTKLYFNFIKPDERPSACTECGQCEEKCPQGITIIEELKRVGEVFKLPSV
jgi:hypothetical protein